MSRFSFAIHSAAISAARQLHNRSQGAEPISPVIRRGPKVAKLAKQPHAPEGTIRRRPVIPTTNGLQQRQSRPPGKYLLRLWGDYVRFHRSVSVSRKRTKQKRGASFFVHRDVALPLVVIPAKAGISPRISKTVSPRACPGVQAFTRTELWIPGQARDDDLYLTAKELLRRPYSAATLCAFCSSPYRRRMTRRMASRPSSAGIVPRGLASRLGASGSMSIARCWAS